MITHSQAEIYIAGPITNKRRMKSLNGFNVYARPAVIVEMSGDRIDCGIECTNVDIEARLLMAKDAV
jgi:hypothetical protein